MPGAKYCKRKITVFLRLFPDLAARETASATPFRVEYKIIGYYNFCTNVADYQDYAVALP